MRSIPSTSHIKIFRKLHLQKFIQSFIPNISILPLQVHYYSEALPTTAIDTMSEFCTPKRYRQLQNNLPKVPTWRLERDSNPRYSDRKALSLPMRHHTQQIILHTYLNQAVYCDTGWNATHTPGT